MSDVRPGSGARMLALLDLLESGGLRGRGELASRLGVDERTVRRDVVRLLEAGVPVESVRGRYGGYRIAPGFRLPPLMLSDDEAVAVLAALADAPTGRDVDLPAATAAAKIRRVLPARSAARLAALAAAVAIPGTSADPVDAATLLEVAAAVREHRPIEIVHRRPDAAGASAPRVVHPYGLVRHGGRWYLSGLALDRGELRTFRLDRVRRVRTLAGRFRPPADHDPAADVLDRMTRAEGRHEVRVRVRADERDVRRVLPPTVARVRPLDPAAVDGDAGWLLVELGAQRLDWVPSALASLDRPFVVEHPDELAGLVRDLALRLLSSVRGHP